MKNILPKQGTMIPCGCGCGETFPKYGRKIYYSIRCRQIVEYRKKKGTGTTSARSYSRRPFPEALGYMFPRRSQHANAA